MWSYLVAAVQCWLQLIPEVVRQTDQRQLAERRAGEDEEE